MYDRIYRVTIQNRNNFKGQTIIYENGAIDITWSFEVTYLPEFKFNQGIFVIHNISDSTRNLMFDGTMSKTPSELEISKKPFIKIEAGYADGSFGVIFSGYIFFIKESIVNATRTITADCIDTIPGELVAIYVKNNENKKDILNKLASGIVGATKNSRSVPLITDGIDNSEQYKIGNGEKGGKLYVGTYEDVGGQIARDMGLQLSLSDKNGIVAVDLFNIKKGRNRYILSAETGMEGSPTRFHERLGEAAIYSFGVEVSHRLLPNIAIFDSVIIKTLVLLDDAEYIVMSIGHSLESRGNNWTTKLKLLSATIATQTGFTNDN